MIIRQFYLKLIFMFMTIIRPIILPKLPTEGGAIVCREYRQGKGNVIRSMFRDIEAECYLMIDGDDTYPAEHAREMCQLVMQIW